MHVAEDPKSDWLNPERRLSLCRAHAPSGGVQAGMAVHGVRSTLHRARPPCPRHLMVQGASGGTRGKRPGACAPPFKNTCWKSHKLLLNGGLEHSARATPCAGRAVLQQMLGDSRPPCPSALLGCGETRRVDSGNSKTGPGPSPPPTSGRCHRRTRSGAERRLGIEKCSCQKNPLLGFCFLSRLIPERTVGLGSGKEAKGLYVLHSGTSNSLSEPAW